MITVRYFAGAAEAAGTTQEQVDAATAADLRAALVAAHGTALDRVLGRCSLLAAGRRVEGADPLEPGVVVDVLPPFAGG